MRDSHKIEKQAEKFQNHLAEKLKGTKESLYCIAWGNYGV